MQTMNALAIFILILIGVICAWGTFSCAFHDNLFQRLGMIVSLFGCLSLISYVWRVDYISQGTITLLSGVLFFAVGTAGRIYTKRRKEIKREQLQFRHR